VKKYVWDMYEIILNDIFVLCAYKLSDELNCFLLPPSHGVFSVGTRVFWYP